LQAMPGARRRSPTVNRLQAGSYTGPEQTDRITWSGKGPNTGCALAVGEWR